MRAVGDCGVDRARAEDCDAGHVRVALAVVLPFYSDLLIVSA